MHFLSCRELQPVYRPNSMHFLSCRVLQPIDRKHLLSRLHFLSCRLICHRKPNSMHFLSCRELQPVSREHDMQSLRPWKALRRHRIDRHLWLVPRRIVLPLRCNHILVYFL